LDNPPQRRGLGIPYYSLGPRPTIFDAPLDTPDRICQWQALTFLTQTPDGLMSRRAVCLLGVTRGYLINDGAPTVLPVARASHDDWLSVAGLLERECPTWKSEADRLLHE